MSFAVCIELGAEILLLILVISMTDSRWWLWRMRTGITRQ